MNITIIDAKTPRWENKENSRIILDVLFEHLKSDGYVYFVADPSDIYQHGVELYNRAVAGEFGEIGNYVPVPKATDSTGEIPVTNTGE
jgi:hypothetical protein